MRLKCIKKFTSSVTKGLLPSQQDTLSLVVCGMMVCRSLCLAEIARCFQTQTQFPHNLKRAWRFASNERINDSTSKEIVARRLIHQLHHRLQIKPTDYLRIIIDWTSVWPYQVLEALIPVDGRAVPVLSLAVHRSDLKWVLLITTVKRLKRYSYMVSTDRSDENYLRLYVIEKK